MKEIVKKFLIGDKFIPEMHLRPGFGKPGFTYSACGPFTKTKEYENLKKETGDLRYIYLNVLHKTSFQHDIFKNLPRRSAPDKALHVKAFDTAKNLKYDGYQWALTSTVYKCFGKKSAKRTANTSAINTDTTTDGAIKSLKYIKPTYGRWTIQANYLKA